MGLPIKLPFLKAEPKIEYFLALVLRDEKISALIFEQQSGKISIVAKHDQELSEPLEETPLDNLVTELDKIISHVESRLPLEIEIKNTVFGVKDDWVEDKKIKKDQLSKLKHVCSELSLSPIGFIVLSEAIAHLIREEEGAPVTALLTEVGKYKVNVSLLRAGKLIESKSLQITSTPMLAVDEALKHFKSVEILPSRIILFHAVSPKDENDKDELTQKFIAHSWSKTLPFLQIPQISILPHEFDGKAIVAGAATQLGFTMTGILHDKSEIRNVENTHSRIANKHEVDDSKIAAKDLTHEAEFSSNDFGFVLEEDIADKPYLEKEHDLKKKDSINDEKEYPEESENQTANKEDLFSKESENQETKSKTARKKGLPFTSALTLIISRIRKTVRLPFAKTKSFIFIPPAIILILIGLLLLYFFQLRATVTLIISPKEVEETQKITFSTKSENNFTQNIIAAKEISVSLDGSAINDATGEKEVGDKAKGTVTLFNSDTAKKTLKEGTKITSDKGLVFLLDKEVTIASASGDIFTGIKSGTAQMTVSADKIGTDYNLPSNSKFSVEGTDVVAAKNEQAFSGGTKKKVTIVTKKDIEKLKEDLPKSLENKAKEELSKKVSSSEEIFSGFTQIELSKENFDKDINDEAKTVKLTAVVKFTSISYDRNDLLNFAQENIKMRYSKDELSKENIDTKLSSLKDAGDTEITAVAAINAGLLPKIEIENIKNELQGKSFTDAKDYIRNISPQIKDANIELSPNLPFLPQIMPRKANNIKIVVQTS